MAVSITPKGNRLCSGKLSVYEEQLFYNRINAGPKTMAKGHISTTFIVLISIDPIFLA